MNEMIRICDVEKYYGSGSNVVKAVDRVSFQVEEGEFVGIMGASGSGKSTLLHLMAAIDHVTSGHIYFGELDITQLSEEALADFRKESLGFVFQNYNLLDTLTIEENIQLAQTLQNKKKGEIQAQTTAIMERLEITDIRSKFPDQVSGGQ